MLRISPARMTSTRETASMADTDAALQSAVMWLLHSGIQDKESDARSRGGVHAWFDLPKHTFSFLYPEITGYYLTTLLYLHSVEPKEEYIEHAVQSGEWLLREARDPKTGAFRCRLKDGEWLPRICSFDNGMCINGLTHLFRVTKEKKYLDAASEVATWLIRAMQKPDGSFFPKYDSEQGIPWEKPEEKWSLRSGAYLAKLAIGFLNLADVTSEKQFTDAARALCTSALGEQESDGRFRTDAKRADTFVHPHCYAAEGLLVAGKVFGEEKFLNAAEKAVEWILPQQLPTGGFPAFFEGGKFLPIESPDISAQVLRLALLCHAELVMLSPVEARTMTKGGASFVSAQDDTAMCSNLHINLCIQRMLSYQCREHQREANGGFFSGAAWFYPSARPTGQTSGRASLGQVAKVLSEHRHVNSWVTMFCTQMLTFSAQKTGLESPFFIV